MIKDIKFTGEFFVPGKADKRIEADHLERYRFASQYCSAKTVLDIACGVGYAAPIFLSAGAARYDGVDVNQDSIEYAREKYRAERVSFSVGDIRTFDSGKTYDLITCFETIEHVEDYKIALANLFRLLKLGGTLLISSPNRLVTSPAAKNLSDKPSNAFHKQEFTPLELFSELRSIGFRVDEANIFGQRQERVWPNKLISGTVHLLFGRPEVRSSPRVGPIEGRVPRYFVVVARKD